MTILHFELPKIAVIQAAAVSSANDIVEASKVLPQAFLDVNRSLTIPSNSSCAAAHWLRFLQY